MNKSVSTIILNKFRPTIQRLLDQQGTLQRTKMSINTPITKLLGIQHPIILAGMYIAGSPELVAAVSNAGSFWALPYQTDTTNTPAIGGLGVVGGLHLTPAELRQTVQAVKVEAICDALS